MAMEVDASFSTAEYSHSAFSTTFFLS